MPFCASCGAQVDGKFCPKCGASIVAGSAAPVTPPATYAAPVSAPMADNVASALCYALGFITGIIFLVLEPYSKNRVVRFHAFQSIFMSVAVIAVDIVLAIILPISLFSWGLYALIWSVFRLACLILWLFVIIWAYQGKTLVLPVIGPLAQKQAQA
jgi:uncharacterized membrane protein